MEQGNVFRHLIRAGLRLIHSLNPFGTGQCLSTKGTDVNANLEIESQSLWNRAMSFDKTLEATLKAVKSLNPFGTGQCLSTIKTEEREFLIGCLNPFGTGQCLSTNPSASLNERRIVSIPLEQGNVFRRSVKRSSW